MALTPGATLLRIANCVFSGILPDSEIFSHHVIVGDDTAAPLDQPWIASVADAMEDHITSMLASPVGGFLFPTLTSAFPNGVQWTRLTVRGVDQATGDLIGDPEYRELSDAGTGGAGASSALPNQCALAVTVRRASFGRRNRNRFYLPPMVTSVRSATPNRVDAAIVEAIAGWLVDAQTELGGLPSPLAIGVYSPAGHDASVITDVHIGDVIDTIRRRRNRIVESRTTEPA